MKRNPKLLSSYEEDLIYMSSRYCIGRNNISCIMHPQNIIKNSYSKMSYLFKHKLSKDIFKEIETFLAHYGYLISLECKEKNCALISYIEFMNTLNEDDRRKFKNATYWGNKEWTTSNHIELKSNGDFYFGSSLPIENLLAWNEAATILNEEAWIDVAGVKYIATYLFTNAEMTNFEKVYKPVDEYLKNPIGCGIVHGVDLAI